MQRMNFSSVEIWLSLKLRIHISCLLFKRNIWRGCDQSMKMVGHDNEGVEEKFSLVTIVEKSLLNQFRRGRDLKNMVAFGRHRSD